MEEYEKYQKKMENYLRLQEMMKYGNQESPYYNDYGYEDMYEEDEQYFGEAARFAQEQYRLMSQGVMYGPEVEYTQNYQLPGNAPGIPQEFPAGVNSNAMMHYQQYLPNGAPSDMFYNYSLVQMDDFLKDEGITGADSTALVNSYYNSLALMQQAKPFLFPPPDLGVIESAGSIENSSKYMWSSSNSNKIIKAKDCGESLKIDISDSKINSFRHMGDISNDEEIPWEIEEVEEEEEEDEENINDKIDVFKKDSSKKRKQNNSPIMLSSYSDSLKSWDIKDYSKSNNRVPTDEAKESYYIIEDVTKEGLTKFLRDTMKVFNDRYIVDEETFDDDIELIRPDFQLIFRYCKYVVVSAKMEKEIPIVALVYLERLLTRTGILINEDNWRRLVLVSLWLASKIWDDDSLENEHFPKVMSDLTLKEINTFERIFLDLIGYDLVVKGAEYAKYYFILRTLAEQNNIKMPLRPLSFDKIKRLQDSSEKIEWEYKEKKIDSYNATM